jgi:hypothetical protein
MALEDLPLHKRVLETGAAAFKQATIFSGTKLLKVSEGQWLQSRLRLDHELLEVRRLLKTTGCLKRAVGGSGNKEAATRRVFCL